MGGIKILSILFLACLFHQDVNSLRRSQRNNPYIVSRWFALPGGDTPYTNCKEDGDGKLVKVQVDPCELDGGACILHTGSNSTIRITFESKVDSANLKAVVHGIVGSVPIPFHIPQGNACEKSGLSCPLKPSQSYDYATQIPVLKTYPRMSVKVKWELVDSENKDVVCVIIPAKIR